MSCPDLILHNVKTSIPAQVWSQHLWSLCSWNHLRTSKLHIPVMLCVTRYSLGLYDMNCYSVNDSHTSQKVFSCENVSKKPEQFSFTLASAPPSMSLLHLYSFVPKQHPVLGTQLISTQKGGSPAWGGSARFLSPNTGNMGCCEHEGAVPAFDWWTVCQLID